jgi:hypothetical protein
MKDEKEFDMWGNLNKADFIKRISPIRSELTSYERKMLEEKTIAKFKNGYASFKRKEEFRKKVEKMLKKLW